MCYFKEQKTERLVLGGKEPFRRSLVIVLKEESGVKSLKKELRFSFSRRETRLIAAVEAVVGALAWLAVWLQYPLPAVLLLFLTAEAAVFLTKGGFYCSLAALLNAVASYACVAAEDGGRWLASPLFWMLLALFAAAMLLSTAVRSSRTRAAQEEVCGDLLHTVAHDLRSPLSTVLGAVTFLQSDAAEASDRTELLKTVEFDLRRMLRTVENRLLLARLSDAAECSVSPELAEEIAAESLQSFRSFYPQIRVAASVPQEPLTVPVNAAILEQVMQNLLEAVVFYLPPTCRPSLSIFRDGDRAVFRFACLCGEEERLFPCADDVPDYRQIFGERLPHRLQTGLTAAQKATERHRGKLLFGAEKEAGAVFELLLPLDR